MPAAPGFFLDPPLGAQGYHLAFSLHSVHVLISETELFATIPPFLYKVTSLGTTVRVGVGDSILA